MDDFLISKVPQISCEDVKQSIDNKENIILLDVRTPEEYSRGRIGGSINIPVDKIECDLRNAVSDRNQKIVVYCLSGSRSVQVVDAMIKMGYSQVFDMKQGLLAWRAKYFPTTV